jgi:hypothetical protein
MDQRTPDTLDPRLQFLDDLPLETRIGFEAYLYEQYKYAYDLIRTEADRNDRLMAILHRTLEAIQREQGEQRQTALRVAKQDLLNMIEWEGLDMTENNFQYVGDLISYLYACRGCGNPLDYGHARHIELRVAERGYCDPCWANRKPHQDALTLAREGLNATRQGHSCLTRIVETLKT